MGVLQKDLRSEALDVSEDVLRQNDLRDLNHSWSRPSCLAPAEQLDYCSPSGFGRSANWCATSRVKGAHGGHDPTAPNISASPATAAAVAFGAAAGRPAGYTTTTAP